MSMSNLILNLSPIQLNTECDDIVSRDEGLVAQPSMF
jgi:hypothetical protein